MALCFFFLCLSACSAFCAARWERPFEDLLPISCGGILCILFCAGMAGFLKLGVVLIICLCALGWLLTLREIMGGGFARFRRAFFTPGFFLFLLFQALFAFCLWGKLFDKTDELTHWGDIVRILCNLDAFGTAPGSNAQYASYPPGMALMQYFLQKLHCWRAGQPLAEWLCYYAYQVLLLAFLMPFCRRGRQDLLGYGLFAAVAFCLPLLFFSHYYESLLLDPFLGVLTGAGIGTVAWKKRRDWVYHATVWATCAVLVLAKDAGLLFAVGIAAMYVLEGWQAWSRKQRIGFSVGALSAVLLPKALWSWNVACSQVAVANQAEAVFGQAISLTQLVDILLGRDSSYRQEVWNRLCQALVSPNIPVLSMGSLLWIDLPVLALLVLTPAAVAGILWLGVKKQETSPRCLGVISGVLAGMLAAYTIGVILMYLFKFLQVEALLLMSYDRYFSILFQIGWTVLLLGLLVLLPHVTAGKAWTVGVVLAVVLAVTSPASLVLGYLTRGTVAQSRLTRSYYQPMADTISAYAGSDDMLYVVSRNNYGFDALMLRYCTQVKDVSFHVDFSQNHTDMYQWLTGLSCAEWRDILWEKYDYVALYQLEDDFSQKYGSLFETPGDIREGALFRVDRQSGKLVTCP